jgi:hypothetical protein
MIKSRTTRHVLLALTIIFAVTSSLGCIAAVPIAVKYYKDKETYVAKAELPAPAHKVYNTAVSMAEEKKVEIVEKDDQKLVIKVTDGKQTASLKAVLVNSEKSEITVTSSIPDAKEREQEQKELGLRIIDNVCARLKVKCTVTKQ